MITGKVYRWDGESQKAPIVCLHGFLGSGVDFRIMAKAFVNHRTCIAPDFPDYSREPGVKKLTWQLVLDELKSFLLAETGAQPPILLGYSMGGRIALQFAARYPEHLRALVMIGATPGIAGPTLRKERIKKDLELALQIQTQDLDRFLSDWFNQPLLKSQNRIERNQREAMMKVRRRHNQVALAFYLTTLGTGTMDALWSELKAIDLPTLLVTGEEDRMYTEIAAEMAGTMPEASHRVIKGAGHSPCFEQPVLFIEQLATFLKKLDSGCR